MNAKPTEETIQFDGLIEGRVPAGDSGEAQLREWAAQVSRHVVSVTLEVDGDRFSLLPENNRFRIPATDTQPDEQMAAAMRDLLTLFPLEGHGLFSTLHSTEYRPGEEVQSLYKFHAGEVEVQQRTVPCDTVAPPQPLSRREIIKAALVSTGILVTVFLISSLFIDYGALFGEMWSKVAPYDMDAIEVDAARYERFFTVEKKELKYDSLVLVITRGKDFPKDRTGWQPLWKAAADSMEDRLMIESLARDSIRVQLYGEKEKYLGASQTRMSVLFEEESFEVVLPLTSRDRISRIEFCF